MSPYEHVQILQRPDQPPWFSTGLPVLETNLPPPSTPPPPITTSGSVRTHRASMYSNTGSIFSEASNSKYPSYHGDETPGTPPPSGAFLPYEYDPTDDLEKPFTNPSSPTSGFVSWSMGGSAVFNMTAAALAADTKTQISNRLVP